MRDRNRQLAALAVVAAVVLVFAAATVGRGQDELQVIDAGGLVIEAWADAGALVPFRIDSDPDTAGWQCPDGMVRVSGMDGLYLIGVTGNGTLNGVQTGVAAYADSDIGRRGGTAAGFTAGSVTVSVASGGAHDHDVPILISPSDDHDHELGGSAAGRTFGGRAATIDTSRALNHTHGVTVDQTAASYVDQPHPAPARQVIWCEFDW